MLFLMETQAFVRKLKWVVVFWIVWKLTFPRLRQCLTLPFCWKRPQYLMYGAIVKPEPESVSYSGLMAIASDQISLSTLGCVRSSRPLYQSA